MTKLEYNHTMYSYNLNLKSIFLILGYIGCEYALFMNAIEDGNIEVIELLMRQGVDINHKCGYGVTPLLVAVHNNDIETVNVLIRHGADPNFAQKHAGGKTILMESVLKNNKEITEALLNANARINDVTKISGNNALILATIHGSIECLKILLQRGSNVDQQNNNGKTALSMAAKFGSVESIEILLQHNASINVQDYSKKTALMYAAFGNHADCVKILIASGAMLDITDNEKLDALMLSLINNEDDKCPLLLIRSGCSLHNVSMSGYTPLQICVNRNRIPLIKEMIKHGVNVNQCTFHHTALWHATNQCSEECVKILLTANASPNIGHPPLVIAARYHDNFDCIQMLLEAGASVNRTDPHWGSFIQAGVHQGSYEIVKTALDAGSDVNISPIDLVFPAVYNQDALMMLFAAGEENSYFSSTNAPKCIVEAKTDFNLQNQCRTAIRKQLAVARPKCNMFRLVKLLPVPNMIKSYLLFDVTL